MDISDSHRPEQEELSYSLAPKMFGDAVLVSHAIVRQWDSDDMQMQGLQKAMGTREASLRSFRAGMDMLCNLFDQEQEMAAIAEYIGASLRDGVLSGPTIGKSIARVTKRRRC